MTYIWSWKTKVKAPKTIKMLLFLKIRAITLKRKVFKFKIEIGILDLVNKFQMIGLRGS